MLDYSDEIKLFKMVDAAPLNNGRVFQNYDVLNVFHAFAYDIAGAFAPSDFLTGRDDDFLTMLDNVVNAFIFENLDFDQNAGRYVDPEANIFIQPGVINSASRQLIATATPEELEAWARFNGHILSMGDCSKKVSKAVVNQWAKESGLSLYFAGEEVETPEEV